MNTTHATAPQETPRSEQVARRLRGALAELDINASEASRMLGISQSNFQRQTKGHVKLSVDQLDHIEKVIGIPMAYLLGLSDELPAHPRRFDADVLFLQPKAANRRPKDYTDGGSVIHVDFSRGSYKQDPTTTPETRITHATNL